MYYFAELGWGKRNSGYAHRCRVAVEQIDDRKYRIHGINYYPGTRRGWVMNPKSIWGSPDNYGVLTGILEAKKKVTVQHKSLQSIVTATVIEKYPVEKPKSLTSPLER